MRRGLGDGEDGDGDGEDGDGGGHRWSVLRVKSGAPPPGLK